MNYPYQNKPRKKDKPKYIPVTNLPRPKPPKFWKPTMEEIKRNSLLKDAYGIK